MACSPAIDMNYLERISITSDRCYAGADSRQDLFRFFAFQNEDDQISFEGENRVLWLPSYRVLDLVLFTPPVQSETHNFQIELELNDGRILDLELGPITITP